MIHCILADMLVVSSPVVSPRLPIFWREAPVLRDHPLFSACQTTKWEKVRLCQCVLSDCTYTEVTF